MALLFAILLLDFRRRRRRKLLIRTSSSLIPCPLILLLLLIVVVCCSRNVVDCFCYNKYNNNNKIHHHHNFICIPRRPRLPHRRSSLLCRNNKKNRLSTILYFSSSTQQQPQDDDDDNDEGRVGREEKEEEEEVNDNGNDYETKASSPQQSKPQQPKVYTDLQLLEQSIARDNAESNLAQVERTNTLDYMAQCKRPIYRDLRSKVILPMLLGSAILTITMKVLASTTTTTTTRIRWIGHIMSSVLDVHFWSTVVIGPMILLGLHNHQQGQRLKQKMGGEDADADDQAINKIATDDPDYLQFVSDYDDPKTSTKDYVKCLLEQWTSSVMGMAVLAGVAVSLLPLGGISISGISSTYRHALQLLTRIGAYVSIHQYPRLYYELVNPKQPRPLSKFVRALQSLVSAMQLAGNNLFPWVIAMLLSQCLHKMNWTTIGWTYSIMGYILAMICYDPQLLSGVTGSEEGHQQPQRKPLTSILLPRRSKQLVFVIAAVVFAKKTQQCTSAIVEGFRAILHQATTALATTATGAVRTEKSSAILRSIFMNAIVPALKRLATPLAVVIASLGPIVHIVAFRKLLRVSKSHNISLGSGTQSFMTKLREIEAASTNDNNNRIQWRWRLLWREPPQRVQTVIQNWYDQFWYWLFFQGSVQDRIRKEYASTTRQGEAHRRGLSVLQQMSGDMKRYPSGFETPGRDQWKTIAMDRLAERHKEDYERGGTYPDPLGVAVYKTFGIGLGYNFDHMSKLNATDAPSSRRLQARAAKSAVRRAQELYSNDSISRTRAELDAIKDPKERDCRAKELRQQTENEIQSLAKRLSELVPTDRSLDAPLGRDRIEQYSTSWNAGSPRDMNLAVQRLLNNDFDDVNKKNRGSSSSNDDTVSETTSPADVVTNTDASSTSTPSAKGIDDDDENDDDDDDEFIKEWMKRETEKYSIPSTTKDNGKDDDDDDDEMIGMALA